MRLIVDAMGGDHAPEEIVIGAALGKENCPGLQILFTGKESEIREILDANRISSQGIEIEPSETQVEMEDDPLCILKSKKDSSMARGFQLLRDGAGDAFLSAGSTGALLVGASSRIYKNKIPGVKRCAIGSVLPFQKPCLLLDSGANIEVTSEELCQFALMGKAYAEDILGVENARIGLVNNGAEETKGTPLYVETHQALKAMAGIRFVGNVEAREIPFGACDVLVCDGFSGNLILKLAEGMGKFFSATLKEMLLSDLKSKLGALFLKKKVLAFRENFSYEKYGGAPLLGTRKPVIKAHGSSKRSAIASAVVQAERFSRADLGEKIESWIGKEQE